ncbi:hypothetical protein BASA60_007265 [Batrachochytrium salamandrivorans]|nr:hypothetical protein BASA60_007265 [Batrachochytrium salamandrivorans]KAH6573933.1 hypothetical protein BASA62_002695 [Batrachochytrium salamandrivorans]
MASTTDAINGQRLPLKTTGRPNQHFELGVKGRKTGWEQTKQVRKDADGLDNVDDFFQSDDEGDNNPARPLSNTNRDADRQQHARFGLDLQGAQDEEPELEEDSRFFDESFHAPTSPVRKTIHRDSSIHGHDPEQGAEIDQEADQNHQRASAALMSVYTTPTEKQTRRSMLKPDTVLNDYAATPTQAAAVADQQLSNQKHLKQSAKGFPISGISPAPESIQTPNQFISRPKLTRTPLNSFYDEPAYAQTATRSAPRQSMSSRDFGYQMSPASVHPLRKSITPQPYRQLKNNTGPSSIGRNPQMYNEVVPRLPTDIALAGNIASSYDQGEFDIPMDYGSHMRDPRAVATFTPRRNPSRQNTDDQRSNANGSAQHDRYSPQRIQNQHVSDVVGGPASLTRSTITQSGGRRALASGRLTDQIRDQDGDSVYYNNDDIHNDMNPQSHARRRLGIPARSMLNPQQYPQQYSSRRPHEADEMRGGYSGSGGGVSYPSKRQRSMKQMHADYNGDYNTIHDRYDQSNDSPHRDVGSMRAHGQQQYPMRPQRPQHPNSVRMSLRSAEASTIKDEDVSRGPPARTWVSAPYPNDAYDAQDNHGYYDSNLPDEYPESQAGDSDDQNYSRGVDEALERPNNRRSGPPMATQRKQLKPPHLQSITMDDRYGSNRVEFADSDRPEDDTRIVEVAYQKPTMRRNGRKGNLAHAMTREAESADDEGVETRIAPNRRERVNDAPDHRDEEKEEIPHEEEQQLDTEPHMHSTEPKTSGKLQRLKSQGRPVSDERRFSAESSHSVVIEKATGRRNGSLKQNQVAIEPTPVSPVKQQPQMKRPSKRKDAIAKNAAVSVEVPIKPEDESENASDGARRSRRTRVQPVAYWKNERVVYGRRVSGFGGVPTCVKEVIRIPSDDENAHVSHRRARADKIKKEEMEAVPSELVVVNYTTGAEESQRIVVTPGMISPRTVGAGDYRFQKVFSEGDFLASGVLALPRGANKPSKNSHESAMIFVVLIGQVQVRVHKTTFVISQGSQFFVPRGNQYEIDNISNREARLFFCHGKEVAAE